MIETPDNNQFFSGIKIYNKHKQYTKLLMGELCYYMTIHIHIDLSLLIIKNYIIRKNVTDFDLLA